MRPAHNHVLHRCYRSEADARIRIHLDGKRNALRMRPTSRFPDGLRRRWPRSSILRMPTRLEIQEKAREFIGTPFAHQGRIKGQALDCAGLPLLVAEELGIKDRNGDPMSGSLYCNYGPQPQSRLVQDACRKHFIAKGILKMKPGDIVTIRNSVLPCHVAIVSERGGVPYIIHAYNGGTCKCVEHILDMNWRRRIECVFEFPGVTD